MGYTIIAKVECCGFDARCMMNSFKVTVSTQNTESQQFSINCRGEQENSKVLKPLKKGDTLIFNEVKCSCPGDEISRLLPDEIIVKINQ